MANRHYSVDVDCDYDMCERTEQNRTVYFDREVSVHIYKYIHMHNTYASSYRYMMLCIN